MAASPEPEEKQEQQEPTKKSSKKLLIIVLAFLLLAGGGGAFAYFKFLGGGSAEKEQVSTHEEEMIIKELDTFIVNLNDPGGKRYLKLTMKARVDSKPGLDEFNIRNFEIRDALLMILSAKGYDEISRAEDKLLLKQEFVSAMNRVLHKGKVKDIYFTEFLIQ